MAKTSTTFFEPEFVKTPDFTQWQAEFTRAFADFSKLWTNGKAANVDVSWLLSYQRKNFEALTVANQRAFEGVQAIAKAQAEFVREAAEGMQKVAKEFVGAGSTEDKMVKQANVAKDAFETAVANAHELAGLVQKSNAETFEVIRKRVVENFDEVKAAFEPKVAKKAA
ncbi:MAG TPA: phasin family protein [Dongiaceae bacterium]|jgi:phasin family protein